ncbi:hypothetical protein BaRGS_00006827 [Batillaria attramentaria]|uniref:Uncharacterized protein n=1 Tax=Batillaria attramentaria TaxID=370345 RepID=A0ABD0LRB3_9CAEN
MDCANESQKEEKMESDAAREIPVEGRLSRSPIGSTTGPPYTKTNTVDVTEKKAHAEPQHESALKSSLS